MAWLGLSQPAGSHFDPRGLMASGAPAHPAGEEDALLVRGSLVIETLLPDSRRPEPLVLFGQGGSWPLKLALQAVPGGGLNLVLEQAGRVLHRTLNQTGTGRADMLRLTYSWDAPCRWGRLALERVEDGQVQIEDLHGPQPWRLRDLEALVMPGPFRFVAPPVQYIALSDRIEPVGPNPGLAPQTPVAVPGGGYRPLSDLRRGDLVRTGGGELVPVLHVLSRQVPACGAFRPVRLRAPYFGLLCDVEAAPFQRLLLSGSEVEYLFGQQSVLVPARHLTGTRTAVHPENPPLLTTWMQLILPGHAAPLAAGAEMESLHIGRLRRYPQRLQASLLAGLDRQTLPEHGPPRFAVLKAFDATVLAERRTA